MQGNPGPPGPPSEQPILPPDFLRRARRRRRSVPTFGDELPPDKGDPDDDTDGKMPNVDGEPLEEVINRIFTNIDQLDDEIQEIKFPRGVRSNPARSCKDILLGHPESEDGERQPLKAWYGTGHGGTAVFLSGFAINWWQITRQPHLHDPTHYI